MKIRKNNICLIALLLYSFFVLIVNINADVAVKGYYPVTSKGEFCTRTNPSDLPDNPLYKNWCKREFINGSLIYEAYRQVAFNIKYTPEPPKVDLWQTPYETLRFNGGDCEDAILLFHQLLTPNYRGGEIIWGLVSDIQTKTTYPHVWFQLVDRKGNRYIVEPFSGDWNGIIPIKMINKREHRKKIIGLPNNIIKDIMEMPLKHKEKYKNIKDFFKKHTKMQDWSFKSQIDYVFSKLINVARRHKRQQQEEVMFFLK